MELRPLLTHEIGSLDKPSWRVKPFRDISLSDKDIESAQRWGKMLEIESSYELIELLSKRAQFTDDEKNRIIFYSSLYATRLLEQAGVEVVYDGEQSRVEMYEYPIRRTNGFVFKGHVRSFDNKYYRKASCVEKPSINEPFHIDEYERITAFAKRPVKIPITGAYTLVDWSYDEFYLKDVSAGEENIGDKRKGARKKFLSDMARDIIYPNIKSLYEKGAKFIQIDEPAGTTKRDEIDIFIDSLKESIGDLKGKFFMSVHICFSDYSLLFPKIEELEGMLDEVHFEYANRDSRELGVNKKARRGYEILEKLKNTDFTIGLGVLDVHTDFIESPELVRDRILYAVDVVGDPGRIFVSPDCGLRTRTWDVSYEKLKNMVEGRDLALKELGL
jgi:5-methyltetrahydropteroyltriglutamate--homocysteine methyltransferase